MVVPAQSSAVNREGVQVRSLKTWIFSLDVLLDNYCALASISSFVKGKGEREEQRRGRNKKGGRETEK